MNQDDRSTTISAMRAYGGGFVSALADAYERADRRNCERIESAFPDVIANYGPGSTFFQRCAQVTA